jgi:uncharacterized protein (DUF2236 family)
MASGQLAVGRDAATLGEALLSPPWTPLARPVGRWITKGLLPEPFRSMYGWSWTASDERRLDRFFRSVKILRRTLPQNLAKWKVARKASV